MAKGLNMPRALEFRKQIVWVYTNDLEETSDYYGSMLGLRLERDEGTARIFGTCGQASIGVCQVFEDRVVQPAGGMITLVTDNVDGWYENLKDKGADLLGPPRRIDAFGVYGFFSRDPNGYVVEIQCFVE